jgi:tRNA acetyltransferase TAN1
MKSHTDLLVSYSWGGFRNVRNEIIATLAHFGDPAPTVDRTSVFGIALVRTSLNNRAVIKQCRALWQEYGSRRFQFAIKWVPVDYWCETDLDAIKEVIDTKLKDRIKANQTWGMVVKRRRYQKHHTIDVVRYLAEDIDRKVDLNEPDWIVWVDIIGKATAIALLKRDETFSSGLTGITRTCVVGD